VDTIGADCCPGDKRWGSHLSEQTAPFISPGSYQWSAHIILDKLVFVKRAEDKCCMKYLSTRRVL
jgi:hypothetical protein